MNRFKRFVLMAVFWAVAKRVIVKQVGGAEGVRMRLMEVMPKMMDRAFGKLEPEKREEMLANCHAVLAGLDEKYGVGVDLVEEPVERVAA